MPSTPGAEQIIKTEVANIAQSAAKHLHKLNIATDSHIGLEILHQFKMDLLGRYTPAARIFETKAEEDFKHVRVVNLSTKYAAGLLITGLNVFFVYFMILMGHRRGLGWQQQFLLAGIVQIVVEALLFETMECIWVQCIVPALVSSEVWSIGDELKTVIHTMCSNSHENIRYFLNAPDFLFLCTALAKKHPLLMESMMVQLYSNHVPGKLSARWQNDLAARGTETGVSNAWARERLTRRVTEAISRASTRLLMGAAEVGRGRESTRRRRNVSLLSSLLVALQLSATAPFVVHRVFVRFVQPFFLTAVLLFFYLISNSPVLAIVVGVLVLGVVGYYAVRRLQKQQRLR